MALDLYDTETFEGSIANGATEQLEVDAGKAKYAQVMLDDGTTGGTPAEYTVTQEYYHNQFDDYMQYSQQTTQTATTIRTDSRGSKLRFTFENTSGASATYRIIVQTFTEY